MYKADLCFLARATPWLPIGELPDRTGPLLVSTAKQLLEANRDRPVRTTTGTGTVVRRPGPHTRLWVYGRARMPCLRCGTPIRVGDQDGRPAYWCPRCQTGPTA